MGSRLSALGNMRNRPGIPGRPRRRYDASRRRDRAAATRARILRAGEQLFAERGFGAVTAADIAGAADVSVPTVYATLGSKTRLLGALLTSLEGRAGGSARRDRIRAEPDPLARIAEFVQWSRVLYQGGIGVIRAVHRSPGDPAMTELRREGDRRRRAGVRELVTSLAQDGALTLRRPDAIDRAFVLTGPDVYLGCVDDCGWAPRRYERWLTGVLSTELVGPSERPE